MTAPTLDITLSHVQGDFTLDVCARTGGRALAIMGPSGAGKSTLLRAIAGLERPRRASVHIGGELIEETPGGLRLPPERRRLGCLFQEPLLFPHLDVQQNLRFGERTRAAVAFEQVVELLELEPLLARAPGSLSGGEARRVALGRALLRSPRLLLLDEPLVALHGALKARLLPALRRLRSELGIPFVLVTHVWSEAAQVADEVLLLDRGSVRFQGPVDALWGERAASPLIGAFDLDTLLPATVEAVEPGQGVAVVRHGRQRFRVPAEGLSALTEVELVIRADELILSLDDPHRVSVRNHLHGVVERVTDIDGRVIVQVDCDGAVLRAEVTAAAAEDLGLRPGLELYCLIKTRGIQVVAAGTAPR